MFHEVALMNYLWNVRYNQFHLGSAGCQMEMTKILPNESGYLIDGYSLLMLESCHYRHHCYELISLCLY